MKDLIFVVQYMLVGWGLSREADVMGAGFASRSVGRRDKSRFESCATSHWTPLHTIPPRNELELACPPLTMERTRQSHFVQQDQ